MAESRKSVELAVLSYERLKVQDEDEVKKMIRALSNEGFFFLDLSGPSAKDFLADLPPVLRHQRNFFEQPKELKNKYYTGEKYKGLVSQLLVPVLPLCGNTWASDSDYYVQLLYIRLWSRENSCRSD